MAVPQQYRLAPRSGSEPAVRGGSSSLSAVSVSALPTGALARTRTRKRVPALVTMRLVPDGVRSGAAIAALRTPWSV